MCISKNVEVLKKKRDAIDARIKLVQNREKLKAKKDETRRKILVGSYFLEKARKNGEIDELVKRVESFLVRDSDRKVFGLPLLKKDKNGK